MSDFLQRNLDEKSSQQQNLSLLKSQWDFDKKLIPKALQAVGQLFSNYSRHDHSHSDQILINIERLLGDRVNLLSATDTWLLLEAAYWHDIGMVVPHTAFEEALNSPEFNIYRKEVASDNSSELKLFAEKFAGDDLSVVFTGAETPLDAVDKFRLLMAEWFRRHHPIRSEAAVNDPWTEMGISSPRTELIPKRLFGLLGRICSLHGAKFDEVLAQLPYKEVGMANDDCHPRYVACLLRLGDLLDMDDNRFCPVMQRIAGDMRTALSKAHEDKHRSIKHFRLDPERIEISAICETIDGYVEQWKWLDWLRNELQDQMAHWQDIVPSPKLGLLPTLGDVYVEISGKQLVTQPGVRPEFNLNAAKVMDLLKGENLYKPEDFVREILQNAVDASLLKAWLDMRHSEKSMSPSEMYTQINENYSVDVSIKRIDCKNPEGILWEFSVADRGIGISQSDLHYMMSIGGSSQNNKKIEICEAMPAWMRPSGKFGIGFQSVFMWTDKVNILTKSVFTNELLLITLNSPTGSKKGLVTVELVDDVNLERFGSTVKFSFVTKSRDFGVSRRVGDSNFVNIAYDDYDPMLDNEIPLRAYSILDSIKEFSKHALVSVNYTFKNGNNEISSSVGDQKPHGGFDNYYSESGVCFTAEITRDERGANEALVYYRGQLVKEAKIISYHFIKFAIDIYQGDASEWLTFNRNSLVDGAKDRIDLIVRNTLPLWIERNKAEILGSCETIPVLSMLARLWSGSDIHPEYWENLYNQIDGKWKALVCDVFKSNGTKSQKSIEELIKMDSIVISSVDDAKLFTEDYDFVSFTNDIESKFFSEERLSSLGGSIEYLSKEVLIGGSHKTKHIYPRFYNDPTGQQIFKVTESVLADALETFSNGFRVFVPCCIFPAGIGADALALKSDYKTYGIRGLFPYVHKNLQHLILPFEFHDGLTGVNRIELKRFDDFIDVISQNLEKCIDRDVVVEKYKELIRYIDQDLLANSARWVQRRRNSGKFPKQ